MSRHDFDVLGAKRALLDEHMPAADWVKVYALGLLEDDIQLRLEMVSQTRTMEAAGRFGEKVRLGLRPLLAKPSRERAGCELNGFVDECAAAVAAFLAEVGQIVAEARARRAKSAEIDALMEQVKSKVEEARADKLGLN